MYFLYFIGILCVTLGISYTALTLVALEKNMVGQFIFSGYSLILIVFGCCVVMSAKLASVFM